MRSTTAGWSTNIPCYNPADIVANLRRLMVGEEMVPMHPWWRGFKGQIKFLGKQKYEVSGVVTKLNDTTVEITELPIHVWTEKYKDFLDEMLGNDSKDNGMIKVKKTCVITGHHVGDIFFRITRNIMTI